MKRACAPGIGLGTRRVCDVPLYQWTSCATCGADQRVAVRYRDAVLCLDCYRRAKREERARQRRLTELVRRALAADPTSVAARRLARLCGRAVISAVSQGPTIPEDRALAQTPTRGYGTQGVGCPSWTHAASWGTPNR